jgi:uncharacterized membrane protein YoaK (UPF0700 family)
VTVASNTPGRVRVTAEHPEFLVVRNYPKMTIALLLTFASGLVDIVGFLGVASYFTAHLTGTTVQLGQNLVARNWGEVYAAAAIIGAFFSGSVLGRVLIEIGSRRRIRRIASITLAIEAAILCAVALNRSIFAARPYWGLCALAAAMGIQTATLTGIGSLTVHTTFVTGMVNKIAQLVSHIGFRAYDLLVGKSRSPAEHHNQKLDIEMTLFLLCVWLFYVAGAVAGTWAFALWRLRALLVPVGLLAVSLVTDQFWPLSIQEEKEQSEA